MKKTRKLLLLALSLIMIMATITVFTISSSAADNIASGTGWYIDGEGCLYLTGAVNNTSSAGSDRTPWKENKSKITSVAAKSGSSIDNGINLLSGCENLVSVDLSKLNTAGVKSMVQMFYNDRKLESANLNGLDVSSLDSQGLAQIFNFNLNLKTLDISFKGENQAAVTSSFFYYCEALTDLKAPGWVLTKAGISLTLKNCIWKNVDNNAPLDKNYFTYLTPSEYIGDILELHRVNYTYGTIYDEDYSGWYLGEDNCLYITDDNIVLYDSGYPKPWKEHYEDIETISLGHNIYRIGPNAFSQLTYLKNIYCGDIFEIGDNAFLFCNQLKSVSFSNKLKKSVISHLQGATVWNLLRDLRLLRVSAQAPSKAAALSHR